MASYSPTIKQLLKGLDEVIRRANGLKQALQSQHEQTDGAGKPESHYLGETTEVLLSAVSKFEVDANLSLIGLHVWKATRGKEKP